jgi:lipopolysaccharide/colanic/teichoic acid biosynthesis glycosyltransferase
MAWILFKRVFDVVVAAMAILLLLPLLLLIALLIKLESSGPVIYISKRAGRNYRVFDFYKFRSMRVDADKEIHTLARLNIYQGNTTFIKIKNDPRVTRVGAILRSTSLDELPQLFNVLRGDMSLIGNRPLPLYEAQYLTTDEWALRFLAPAGMTGLWQVSKRGQDIANDHDRKHLDARYAITQSLGMDYKIFLKTFSALRQYV